MAEFSRMAPTQAIVLCAAAVCAGAALAFALAGCSSAQSSQAGSTSADQSDASGSRSGEKIGGVGTANPLEGFDSAQALYEATGFYPGVPGDATGVGFYRIRDTGVSEVIYTIDGMQATYRGKAGTGLEDISGVYETAWDGESEFADASGYMHYLKVIDENVAVISGFDSERDMTYCLVLQGGSVTRDSAMTVYAKVVQADAASPAPAL